MASTFGTGLWGGGGTGAPPSGGLTPLSQVLNAAFRIAAVTDRPMRTPSLDQYAEAILILNRMMGSWSCDLLAVFSQVISTYPLTTSKTYTIGGPGATFAGPRPQKITGANIILNTTPLDRRQVSIVEIDEWREINVQDIPNTIPEKLYCDYAFPTATIYLWGQPLSVYQLELYTWLAMQQFAAVTDLVLLPLGYELAITYNLAILIASHFKTQHTAITEDDREIARQSKMAIESLNAPAPLMKCDAGFVQTYGRHGAFNYLIGR